MKKCRVKNKVRFTAFITSFILVSVLSISSILGFADASASDIPQYTIVKVQSGDTLWSLAKEYGPNNKDVRKVIFDIEQINDINASELQAGMEISIPSN